MARFLSPEWVEAFNEAVRTVDLSETVGESSLAASSGTFSVEQVVNDVPDDLAGSAPHGTVRLVLRADAGQLSLSRREDGEPAAESAGAGPPRDADVSLSISYPDAAALSRGELSPAAALGEGRVKVRGDLAVLVAGQAVLLAAAGRLVELAGDTTY